MGLKTLVSLVRFPVAPHRKPVTYSPVGDWFVFSRAHNLDTNPI